MLSRRQFFDLSPAPTPSAKDYWIHVTRPAMACRFEVTLCPSDRNAISVARNALGQIERLEEQLSLFRDTSELNMINRRAASQPVTVEKSLFELLLSCKQLWLETERAFDVTSGPLSRRWGFLAREGRVPEPVEITEAKSRVGCDKLIFDRESRTVRFETHGVELNLGSVGKGYALDRIAPLIESRIRTALLSAGSSSVKALGSGDRGEHGWTVGLRHPRNTERRLAVLKLRDCAISTSGAGEQFFEHDGKRYGHIIDPRTGQPSEGVVQVTVAARSAAVAEALSTAFFVGGSELANRYCSTHPDTTVIMLEADRDQPFIIGRNNRCDVQLESEVEG